MMKKFAPALTALFLVASPAKADVTVEANQDSTQSDVVEFYVVKDSDVVWQSAYRCDSINKMGALKLQNAIVGYAQDAFEQTTRNRQEAEKFHLRLTNAIVQPVDQTVQACARTYRRHSIR